MEIGVPVPSTDPHPVTNSTTLGSMSDILLRRHAGRTFSLKGIGLDTRISAMSS